MIFKPQVVYDICHEWAERMSGQYHKLTSGMKIIYKVTHDITYLLHDLFITLWNLKTKSKCSKILCCDHLQLMWSQNFILFALSLIKKHKYTSLRNEISVFMFFEIFKKFKWAIYWYHLINWEKEILWLGSLKYK